MRKQDGYGKCVNCRKSLFPTDGSYPSDYCLDCIEKMKFTKYLDWLKSSNYQKYLRERGIV